MLFMLPGGRVPLPEERQRFAVSIQPPWQLVAPDGQRYNAPASASLVQNPLRDAPLQDS
jgi:hypothetical protein